MQQLHAHGTLAGGFNGSFQVPAHLRLLDIKQLQPTSLSKAMLSMSTLLPTGMVPGSIGALSLSQKVTPSSQASSSAVLLTGDAAFKVTSFHALEVSGTFESIQPLAMQPIGVPAMMVESAAGMTGSDQTAGTALGAVRVSGV